MGENRTEKTHDDKSQEMYPHTRNIQLEAGVEKRKERKTGEGIDTGMFLSVQGHFHQGCSDLFGFSSGKQCVANALSSIIFSKVKIQNVWSSSDIDRILTTGNELYGYLQASSTVQNEYLLINELPSEIEVYDKCFSMQIFESHVGLIGNDKQSEIDGETYGISILEALQKSFEVAECSFVCFGGNTFSVMKVGKRYFLFDSHARDHKGLLDANGKSTLIGIETLEGVAQHCLNLALSLSVDQNSQFEITPVNITESGTDALQVMGEISSDETAEHIKNDSLLDRYFDDQECRQKGMIKKKEEGKINTSRKEYIKNYMKNWRNKEHARNIEKVRDKVAKQERRLETEKRNIERERDKVARQEKRLDNERRKIERGRERRARQVKRLDKDARNIEKERDKTARQVKRLDKKIRNIEKEKDKTAKQAKRLDEETRNFEKERDKTARQAKRLDKEIRNIEKERDKTARQAKRLDKEIRNIEKERDKTGRQAKRLDEETRNIEKERDKTSRQAKRLDEETRNIEKERDKTARQAKRLDEETRNIEKDKDKTARQAKRLDKEIRNVEKERDKAAKQRKRNNPIFRLSEKEKGRIAKQKERKNIDVMKNERDRDVKRKRKSREDSTFLELERIRKSVKRNNVDYRVKEKFREKSAKAHKRKDPHFCRIEKIARKCRKYGSTLSEAISVFNKRTEEGPLYVCTCCQQTWFSHSVVDSSFLKKDLPPEDVAKFLSKYISVGGKEWICLTCKKSIQDRKMPKLSIANNVQFPPKSEELELHQLEERLIALRIPFMQIRELPRGRQLSIKGNVVNVPVDIQPTVNSLPRQFNNDITVPVRLKRRLSYKTCDFVENVRPQHVIIALHWLMRNSQMYKDANIHIDEDWEARITADSSEIISEYFNTSTSGCTEGRNTNFGVTSDVLEESTFEEIDEREGHSGSCDTLLDDANPVQDQVYTFAPGEGQTPLSLYTDKDAEFLSFPTIYCGQRMASNDDREVKVHYSDLVKWELRNIDRRAANSVPNLFFKMKKIQMKQISDKVNLVLRRCKGTEKKLTAGDVLNQEVLDKITRLDEGYYIFRTLRNSPPYLEAKKKELFAMIRQLGLPTWFSSLSAADTRWPELLKTLAQLNLKKSLTDEEIDKMTWAEKTDLVQKDPVTCVRFFDHRVHVFINTVLKSEHHPVGELIDFFYRVEFQHRGSPHIHMLMWIKDAPKFKEDPVTHIAKFIDKYVSCSANCDDEIAPLIELQIHKHSRTCRKKGKDICRFGFPQPPMDSTLILEPLSADDSDAMTYKEIFTKVKKELADMKEGKKISFSEFLQSLNLEKEDYIKSVRSSIDRPQLFLKRNPCEIRVNPYMKNVLSAWRANHDLQFVLDPYACAMYIVSYISKSQRGMSNLLDQACKEAREGNMDLKKQVRHMGNKFLNAVEISAQEAAYLNLQLPLTKSSRDVVFINTSPPEERTFLLKSKSALEELPENSTDIHASSIIKRYSQRPRQLENWCLADYAAELEIIYPKEFKENEEFQEQNDDTEDEQELKDLEDEEMDSELIRIVMKNGIIIRQRKKAKCIRYVNYSIKIDSENHFRERILLFHPWRKEQIDIKGNSTYEEKYNQLKSFIAAKVKKYERNAEELEKAQRQAEEVDVQFDRVAPSTEQTEEEDLDEGSRESEAFVYFDPKRPLNHQTYDIGMDLGLPCSSNNDDQIHQYKMTNEQYFQLVSKLNKKQMEFFTHVLHWIKTKKEPLRVFLTGGAGVGKSVVVRALYEALTRHYCSTEGENPDDCKVLLCAPTGKAAFNIKGQTIHSAFKIPASQGFNCKPLDSESLNTLRTMYKYLSTVIIDEVSMVGNSQLNCVHERLKQIKGSKEYFGGINVILIGDLFQLKPVMDGWVFDDLKKNFGPLATNLWRDLFTMHELTEIMRQKDDVHFAELLNRLREGNQTEADIQTLKQRCVDESQPVYPRDAPRLYTRNESVNAYNNQVFLLADGEKVNIPAHDSVVGRENLLQHLNLPDDSSKTAGLAKNVPIALRLQYEITANLCVEDGLTNGTSCKAEYIERRQESTERPSIIWVSFDDRNTGKLWRYQYRHLFGPEVDKSWTPIFDVRRSFQYLRHTVVRIQFPLRLSAAKTIHKSQGDTMVQAVINLDMNPKFTLPHIHYVALSRVTKITGLHILSLNENKICASEKVKKEMCRLRTEATLQLCFKPIDSTNNQTINIAFQNVRSLHAHFASFKTEPNLQQCHIIGVAETWLTASDENEDYELENYNMFRLDFALNRQCGRPHRGIITYIRNDCQINNHVSHSDKDIEWQYSEIKFKNESYQVVVLYRSPSSTVERAKNNFINKLSKVVKNHQNIIIIGDFNIDLCNGGSSVATYMSEAFSCKQIVSKTTHSSGSLIDHIYTNMTCNSITDVIESVYSDHKIIYTSLARDF
ncbi:uncharacterized protein LOC133182702 [Saccostrea echinata]|uniref:uncharacterized protein LOC133182702 n=1 Tax=Saccostrea echinata TaxID=191078 RepID=UPI002A82E810|nr:uncharacterized protein LOC133182702 [Saccostrea echinata]